MDMKLKIIRILLSPSYTKEDCFSCSGKGYRITGAISTSTCSRCSRGKVRRPDHEKTAERILKLIEKGK